MWRRGRKQEKTTNTTENTTTTEVNLKAFADLSPWELGKPRGAIGEPSWGDVETLWGPLGDLLGPSEGFRGAILAALFALLEQS